MLILKYPNHNPTEVIEVENIRKSYGSVIALDGISFEVERGEAFAFLGPNGAGKTTMINILMGFIHPNSGKVTIFGKDPYKDRREINRRIGFLPEEIGLYENLSVYENLDFYARLFRIPKSERSDVIRDVLEKVNLYDRRKSKVKELSYGMKQRLAIAQSLINNPELLIYDEPTAGLDPKSNYEIRKLIKDLLSEGITLFLSSHLLYEVEQICDVVAIIDKGRLIKKDKIENLIKELRGQKIKIRITCIELDENILNEAIKVKGIDNLKISGNTIIADAENKEAIADLNDSIVKAGGRVVEIEHLKPDLEEIFLKITGE